MVASNLFAAHGCWKSNRKDLCLGYWCGRSKESKVTRFIFSLDITFYHSLLSLICYPEGLPTQPGSRPSPLLGRGYSSQSKFGCSKQAAMLLKSRIFSPKCLTEVMSRRLAGLFSYNIEFFVCPDQQRWFTTNVFQPLGRRASAKMAG